jgi:SAM-dependent methyltransferase
MAITGLEFFLIRMRELAVMKEPLSENDKIKEYWDERAAGSSAIAVTTNDNYLRILEAETIAKVIQELELPDALRVFDVGCGDGQTTIRVAETLKAATFLGADYSPAMVARAVANLADNADVSKRVEFREGDILNLVACSGAEHFDVATTDRCIINLPTFEEQRQAIHNIAQCLKPGGYYLALENFTDGQEMLNQTRALIGLPEISVRWHNRFLTEQELDEIASPHFDILRILNFSSTYYYITRVVYSALCRDLGEEPDYQHPIHKVAMTLPSEGNYSPTRMAILRRK